MSATARESGTRFPLLACWPFRLDVALGKVLTTVPPSLRPPDWRGQSVSPLSRVFCILRPSELLNPAVFSLLSFQ